MVRIVAKRVISVGECCFALQPQQSTERASCEQLPSRSGDTRGLLMGHCLMAGYLYRSLTASFLLFCSQIDTISVMAEPIYTKRSGPISQMQAETNPPVSPSTSFQQRKQHLCQHLHPNPLSPTPGAIISTASSIPTTLPPPKSRKPREYSRIIYSTYLIQWLELKYLSPSVYCGKQEKSFSQIQIISTLIPELSKHA